MFFELTEFTGETDRGRRTNRDLEYTSDIAGAEPRTQVLR
jgi:hypothetical protein